MFLQVAHITRREVSFIYHILKMKKIFLIILIGILLSTQVSSVIELKSVRQGDCIDLYQSCPTCTYSSIRTIKFPNGTISEVNLAMDKSNFDYTYEFCGTNLLGDYFYIVNGDKGGVGYESSEEGTFEVTPSGFTNTLGFYIVILLLSIGLVVLGYWREDATIIVLGAFGMGFIGIYLILNGIVGMKDTIYTQSIGLIFIALSSYLLYRGSMEFLYN